jgi:hypothetical protein
MDLCVSDGSTVFRCFLTRFGLGSKAVRAFSDKGNTATFAESFRFTADGKELVEERVTLVGVVSAEGTVFEPRERVNADIVSLSTLSLSLMYSDADRTVDFVSKQYIRDSASGKIFALPGMYMILKLKSLRKDIQRCCLADKLG